MRRLLIVDDDMHLRKLVLAYGESEHFVCDEAVNGKIALEMARNTTYDLILLDVMMPVMEGFETLAEIRKFSQVPIIMLTARDEEYDKLLGFDLGADDYVPKPFSPKELMARVQAVLKRSGSKPSKGLHFGDLHILLQERSVTISNRALALTPKEFDLLVMLAKNERIVMTREQLLDKVWGYDYFGVVRTVDTHIKLLREHLGKHRNIIRTIWGVGYKFEYNEES